MTADDFATLTASVPYVSGGIFPSEIYLFAQACLQEGITAVVESGVRNGMSTRLLHRLPWLEVTSVEVNERRLPKGFPFIVHIADSRAFIPFWIERHRDTRVGVLLDGPKGAIADELRARCFAFPNVRVVAQHDCTNTGRGELVHSWDPGVRLAALDSRVDARTLARHPRGPGLAIWGYRETWFTVIP